MKKLKQGDFVRLESIEIPRHIELLRVNEHPVWENQHYTFTADHDVVFVHVSGDLMSTKFTQAGAFFTELSKHDWVCAVIGLEVGCRNHSKDQLVNGDSIKYTIDHLELRSVEMLERKEMEHLCDLIWERMIDKNLGYEIYIKDLLHPNSRGYFTRQKITDYLRSIGVLVGFRHFTPEMLIADGVVKVKGV